MVSVCMATYNGELYIKQQIESILIQLDLEDELVISDDGSTDKTLEIIKSFNDERIKIFKHMKKDFSKMKYSRNFYYATDNFENSIKNAKGDYIFLADQDDIWQPNKIKRMVQAMNESNCVMCNYDIIDSEEKIVEGNIFKELKIGKSLVKNLFIPPYLGCLMGFKREILKYILPFPKNLIAHDLWIGCLTSKKGDLTFINENLVQHRKHSNNTSNVTIKSKNPFLWKLWYRIILLCKLSVRLMTSGEK